MNPEPPPGLAITFTGDCTYLGQFKGYHIWLDSGVTEYPFLCVNPDKPYELRGGWLTGEPMRSPLCSYVPLEVEDHIGRLAKLL